MNNDQPERHDEQNEGRHDMTNPDNWTDDDWAVILSALTVPTDSSDDADFPILSEMINHRMLDSDHDQTSDDRRFDDDLMAKPTRESPTETTDQARPDLLLAAMGHPVVGDADRILASPVLTAKLARMWANYPPDAYVTGLAAADPEFARLLAVAGPTREAGPDVTGDANIGTRPGHAIPEMDFDMLHWEVAAFLLRTDEQTGAATRGMSAEVQAPAVPEADDAAVFSANDGTRVSLEAFDAEADRPGTISLMLLGPHHGTVRLLIRLDDGTQLVTNALTISRALMEEFTLDTEIDPGSITEIEVQRHTRYDATGKERQQIWPASAVPELPAQTRTEPSSTGSRDLEGRVPRFVVAGTHSSLEFYPDNGAWTLSVVPGELAGLVSVQVTWSDQTSTLYDLAVADDRSGSAQVIDVVTTVPIIVEPEAVTILLRSEEDS